MASLVAQMVKNLLAMQETWVGKIPWKRAWQPTPGLLPGEFRGQRSLAAYSSWASKESDTTERLTHFPLLVLNHLGRCVLWLCWVFCCGRAFSSCGSGGCSPVAGCRCFLQLLLLLWSTGSRLTGFRSCSTWLSGCGSRA